MSKKTLNIMYINHYYRPNDSASISSYEIVNSLTQIGHKVIVLTHDPYALYGALGKVRVLGGFIHFPWATEKVRFLKFLRCTVAYLIIFLACLRLRSRAKIDCIFSQHHNFHFATLAASLLSWVLKIPYVVKIQDGIPLTEWVKGPFEKIYNGYVMRALNGYALRHAKYLLALSKELKSVLAEIFRIRSNQMVIIPNTVGNFAVDSASVEEVRTELGLENKRVLIFVGDTRGRGVDLLVKALPQIASKEPNVRLLVVSQSLNDRSLKSLAVSKGIDKYIQFTGPVSQDMVPILISMSDATIGPLMSFSATVGAVPRKVLEYMACGKPVVSCYGSVSHDLLINGYNGILVKPGDIDELSSAIINLMRDEKLAKQIGNNARKHVSTFYSEGVLVKELTTLMNRLALEI